jgi:tetratricopeptide (TPR) repeat protein
MKIMYGASAEWKRVLIVILLLAFLFCACKKKIDITPQISEYSVKIAKADELFKRGSYACLEEARTIYEELLSFKEYKKQTGEKLIETTLLLALREQELALEDRSYMKKAAELIEEIQAPSEFQLFFAVIDFLALQSERSPTAPLEDLIFNKDFRKKCDKVKEWNSLLKEKAETEEFSAYLYLSLNHSYQPLIDEKADIPHYLELYPASLLIKYKISICQEENDELLKETIEHEPTFAEVYYFLGGHALKKGKLISAEKHFLHCYEHLPKSITTLFSLAKVYYFIGEIEKSLEFYNKTTALAPEHRKALLGKSICLSKLGRHEEAIPILNKLLALGKWYLGESHYWLAWNQNALKRLDKAEENIEHAKLYLPDDSDVFTLAGIIDFKKERIKGAEKNFKKAIRLDTYACQALYYLGRIYSQHEKWVDAGFHYNQAATCYQASEKALQQKIRQIEESSLSHERKQKLILKKEHQIKEIQFSLATNFYNAAACLYNAEMKEEALSVAEKALLHPAYKEKIEQLISKIKELE